MSQDKLVISNHSTTNLSEGNNLYFTNARARDSISLSDNGGDGSLTYNSSTGAIIYTGPSAAETRAHFSGGTGVGIADGVISIGQSVLTTNDVQFSTVTADLTGNVTGQTVIFQTTLQQTFDGITYISHKRELEGQYQ